MNHCETCKYWTPPSLNHPTAVHGCCGKIDDDDFASPKIDDDTQAYMETHGDYGQESSGCLRTLPTFGCLLHEVKP